jgi:hypothetical protein
MRPIFDIPRLQQFGLLLSAVAIAASVYLRNSARPLAVQHSWNRLDRDAPMFDLDGSFPASDPPSSVPAT